MRNSIERATEASLCSATVARPRLGQLGNRYSMFFGRCHRFVRKLGAGYVFLALPCAGAVPPYPLVPWMPRFPRVVAFGAFRPDAVP